MGFEGPGQIGRSVCGLSMVIRIWGRLKDHSPEVIDQANSLRDAEYLVGEYRIAFGTSWKIWAGTRKSEPALFTSQEEIYERTHRRPGWGSVF